jgi:cholesterol oxidase
VPAEVVPITVASADQTSPAGVRQAACTRCGNCFTGCNVGAKNTTVTHVLPDAVRAGARLITGLTVLEVWPLAGEASRAASGEPYRWAVRMALTDGLSSPSRRDGIVVRARTVVLAAGALGSTEILLRSRQLKVSPWLGKRFSTNGDALAMGWGLAAPTHGMAEPDEASRPTAQRVGPTITGMLAPNIQVNGQSRRVLVEEGAVPSALTQAVLALGATLSLPHRYTRGGALGVQAQWGKEGRAVDALATPPDLARHALLLLLMGPDDADGHIRLTAPEDIPCTAPGALAGQAQVRREALNIHWDPTGGPRAPYYQALHEWLLQAGEQGGFQGGDYLPSPLWKPLPDDFAGVAAGVGKPHGLTVHPLGGCGMGDGPDTGVVDWQGTVFRAEGGVYEGLHVLDGAMLPTAVGVNPFVTISGLSLVAARAIRQRWEGEAGMDRSGAAAEVRVPPMPTAQAVVPKRRDAVAPRPGVQLQFREHLLGQWLGNRPQGLPATPPEWTADERQREWVVAVDVDVDVSQWLADPGMRLEGARLRVFHNPAPHAIGIRPELSQEAPLLQGQGWVSLLAGDPPANTWVGVWRGLQAVASFVGRRPWRDLFSAGGEQPLSKRVLGLVRAAGNHAQYRTLDYHFELQPPSGQGERLLARGQKRLAYAPGQKNLWQALIQIDLTLTTVSGEPQGTLAVEVDLIDMVRRQRLQVARAPDTPAAIIGLAGFSALWLRAMFQTHFWSLRGLDYEKLRPPGPAVHGPLRPMGERGPGPVCLPQVHRFQVPRTQSAPPDEVPLTLELTRYAPAAGPHPSRHLLMIHGLAHGATVFSTHTTGGRNMAAAFLAQGYTVWLLDHRLSNRLDYATQPHCMDDVARLDIPAALKLVHQAAGEPVYVFAHCVGGAAFAMATLSGLLNDAQGRSRVKAAAIHAVHPWVVPSASNQLSGELASLYRDWLPANLSINPVPPQTPGALDQFLDRLAASLPWPDSELAAHEADINDPASGTAVCNRMTLFYGREWVHANLAPATHRELASLVGPASVEVFRQLYYVITRQRLTDREGAGVYMTHAQFDAHWQFPVLFSHGTENRVFDPRSAVRSWHQLRHLQSHHPDAPHRQVRLFMPQGYGHMDFLFGQSAHRDVYPALVAFMDNPGDFTSSFGVDDADLATAHQRVPRHWQDHAALWPQRPLCGPMLQLQSAHSAVTADGRTTTVPRALVVWVELPNDPWLLSHPPRLARADDADATPLPGVEVIRLAAVHGQAGVAHPLVDHPANRVTLLEGPGSYWVLRLSDSALHPLSQCPALQLVWGAPASQDPVGGHGSVVLDVCALPWWRSWVHADAAGASEAAISWLATSCRWPGLPFERQAIDALAVHMAEQLHHPERPAQALVLLGDQIYADATANLFQVQEGDERLAQFYRDAWGSTATRSLLAKVPTYFAVDDHEYGDNWDGARHPMADPGFMNGFEANLAYQWRWSDSSCHAPRVEDLPPEADASGALQGRSVVRGFWREFQIGHLPAFAMDTRSERLPRTADTWQDTPLVSEAQMHAVETWLLTHRDRPKVLCSGSVLGWVERRQVHAPALCASSDGWAGFPLSWRRLVRFMVHHQVQHTVFLSGDYHFSGAATLTLSSGDAPPVRAASVVCSGWNASLPFANAVATDFVLGADAALPFSDADASVVSRAQGMGTTLRQFSRLTVSPQGRGHWCLTVEVLDDTGTGAALWMTPL